MLIFAAILITNILTLPDIFDWKLEFHAMPSDIPLRPQKVLIKSARIFCFCKITKLSLQNIGNFALHEFFRPFGSQGLPPPPPSNF